MKKSILGLFFVSLISMASDERRVRYMLEDPNDLPTVQDMQIIHTSGWGQSYKVFELSDVDRGQSDRDICKNCCSDMTGEDWVAVGVGVFCLLDVLLGV